MPPYNPDTRSLTIMIAITREYCSVRYPDFTYLLSWCLSIRCQAENGPGGIVDLMCFDNVNLHAGMHPCNPVLSLHSTWPSSTYASYNLSLHVYIIHCLLTYQQSFPILISPLFIPPICSCFPPSCVLQ